jgi:hypothetical protein
VVAQNVWVHAAGADESEASGIASQ